MGEFDYEGAKQYALERLRRELSPLNTYHSIWHTEGDVLPAAERLAVMEGVSGDELLLLKTAAVFHDIGYCIQRKEHELVGVGIIKTVLPQFGYSLFQVHTVGEIIMATRLPPNPKTLLEKIIADSDMDSLGREDFMKTSLALRTELEHVGVSVTDKEWFIGQRKFLQGHSYFTESARLLRNVGKRKNIDLLSQLIEQLD